MVRASEDNVYDFRAAVRIQQQVQFPSLEHFVDDVQKENIGVVRLDLFEQLTPSELSFIHYVTLTLFVTASDRTGLTLYEYREPLGTRATADAKLQNPDLQQRAQTRLLEVADRLKSANLAVRYGRFTVSDEPMD